MPIYTYQKYSDSIIIINFYQPPKASDVFHAIDEISKIDSTGFRLWDLSEGFDLSTEDILEIAKYARNKWPHTVKVAFIASDNLAFGNLRMFSSYRQKDNEQFMVFRNKEEAIEFIENVS